MISVSRDPFDFKRLRDNQSSGYGSLNQFKDSDFTNSLSVRGVSHNVTNRARNAAAATGLANGNGVLGNGGLLLGPQRFMSLEEECNWILSGREPVVQDQEFYDDDDDNTLDDISGDEVLEFKKYIVKFDALREFCQ